MKTKGVARVERLPTARTLSKLASQEGALAGRKPGTGPRNTWQEFWASFAEKDASVLDDIHKQFLDPAKCLLAPEGYVLASQERIYEGLRRKCQLRLPLTP
jgi:hypothetical protein